MKKFLKLTVAVVAAATMLLPAADTAFAESKNKTVYLGGQPFGVKFYNDGVIIVELEEFYKDGHYICPAKDGGLKVNDIIKKVNGRTISSNEDIQSATKDSNGKEISFAVERDGQTLEKKVVPAKNTAGMFLIGAWVRDSCAGIGTVTYYDSGEKYFAALGHGICDSETNALLPLKSAEIVKTKIGSVIKSTEGKPGSLNGYFTGESFGELIQNTQNGVYGTVSDEAQMMTKPVELAENSEIKTGEALVYTTISDGGTQCYEAEITRLCDFSQKSNENFVIKITDESLLEKCGGIVQGMSGSPIVQNGKLVGAVTHVFLSRPDEGFGITAQNMVSNYNS